MAVGSFMAGAVDWRGKKTASDCLKHLYQSNHLSDVVFTFKQDGALKLSAHRFVLTMRSAVFETMFYGSMPMTQEEILLEDDDPESFQLILKYIYADDIEITATEALACLYSATKYCLDGLVSKCSDVLKSSISTQSVCIIYERAKTYGLEHLQKLCHAFILEHADEVFKLKHFLLISRDSLEDILADDELTGNEQNNVRTAVMWATNQCTKNNVDPSVNNLRLYLGDALYRIRFPLIPMDVFAKAITPSKLLSNEEQVMLYQYMATIGNRNSPKKLMVGPFSAKERQTRKAKTHSASGEMKGNEALRNTCDENMLYNTPVGYPCHGGYRPGYKHTAYGYGMYKQPAYGYGNGNMSPGYR